MKTKLSILALVVLSIAFSTVNANAPSFQPSRSVTPSASITKPSNPLNMTLLSATINGCSQVANINATWTGQAEYYPVHPSEFILISIAANTVYSNSTNVAFPNNSVSDYYLFKNTPITLRLSFEFCAIISTEHLVFMNGQFTFILH